MNVVIFFFQYSITNLITKCYFFGLTLYDIGNALSIVNITEAARLVGKSRRTLQRHLSQGLVSKCDTATGEYGIDISELLRVYGPFVVAPNDTDIAKNLSHHDIVNKNISNTKIDFETHVKMVELLKENEMLKLLLEEKDRRNEDLKKTLLLLEDKLAKPIEKSNKNWFFRIFSKK